MTLRRLQPIRLGILLFMATALSASATFAEHIDVRIYGTVTSVDAPLGGMFSVGELFEFGFSLDTIEDLVVVGEVGTRYYGRDVYFKAGGSYTAITSTHQDLVDFHYSVFGLGPTRQGFNFETNNLLGPNVSGLPLANTYLVFGFGEVFSSPDIDASDILALNGTSIIGDLSEFSFRDGSNYQYVRLGITSFVAVPDPRCFSVLLVFSGAIIGRRFHGKTQSFSRNKLEGNERKLS